MNTQNQNVAPGQPEEAPGASMESERNGKTFSLDLWKQRGRIEAVGEGLHVYVEGVNGTRAGIIPRFDAVKLARTLASASIIQAHDGPGDTQVITEVGRAWRSRSGRGLIVSMDGCNGECSGSWGKFVEVVHGQRRRILLGTFEPLHQETHPQPAPASDMTRDLEGRF